MDHRIRYLDGWRGLAIIGVLIGHFVTENYLNSGRVGVELFFVLSGRLMAQILFVERAPLIRFFPRRGSRIYPVLIAFGVMIFAASQFLPQAQRLSIGQFLSVLTLTANYYDIYVDRSSMIDHIWSLCVEEHMYILLGILAAWHRMRTYPLLPVIAAIALIFALNGALQTIAGIEYAKVYWRSDVHGASILFGAFAYLAARERKFPSWIAPAALVAGLLLNFDSVPDIWKYTAGTAAFALSVAALPSAMARFKRGLEFSPLIGLGVWSYSIYLWQQPFHTLGQKIGHPLILLPLAMLAGLASFFLFEKPMRRLLNGWVDRFLSRTERSASLKHSAAA